MNIFLGKKIENNKRQKKILLGRNFVVDFLATLFVVFVVFFVFQIIDRKFYFFDNFVRPGQSYVQTKGGETVVLGEEKEKGRDPVAKSENYKSTLITFGGNTAMPDSLKEAGLLISEVKSELLTTKSQDEIKLVISWKTNKAAISDVEYGRSADRVEKTVNEDKYGYSHSAILPSLDHSTAYVYRIKSKDKWGNQELSENFAFYTGAPNVSLLDLLLGAFKDVFSWAVKE